MRVVLILSTCHWRLNEHVREVTFNYDDSVYISSRLSRSFVFMNGINKRIIRGFRSSLSHFHGTRVIINNERSTWSHQH